METGAANPHKDRQDAAFHTPSWDVEVVYKDPDTKLLVYRAGEMRIEATDATGRPVTIRTTGDLEDFGIWNDEQLAGREGDVDFEWINNPWFEVVDPDDQGGEGEVFHALDEAIAAAKRGSR